MKAALLDPSLFTIPYDRRLIEALQARGHEVKLFGRPLRPGEAQQVAGLPLEQHFYRWVEGGRSLPRRLARPLKAVNHVWSMAGLVRRLRRWRPDVIHLQWALLPAADRLFLPRLRGVAPVVMTVHDSTPFNGVPAAGLQALGVGAVLVAVDQLIVHTAGARDRLVAAGLAAERVSRIPHGTLDEPRQGQHPALGDGAPCGAGPSSDEVMVLLFGKLQPYKGADVLIRAVAALPPEARDRCRVVIAGQPRMDVEGLRELAASLDVDRRVVFDLRFVPDDEMHAMFRRCSILAFPYRTIDTSGVLMAGLAAGRPIVASRLGTFAERLVDGEHGYLVPPDDPPALAAALQRLIADPAARAAMGKRVGALADDVPGWDEIAEKTEAVYRRAIADHRRPDGPASP